MTRKTPSRTKRELEKIRRQRRNGDGDDGPREVVVELGGIPARGPEGGGLPRTDDADGFEEFRVDLETGEVETPGFPDPEDCPECSTPDCQNPALPGEFGVSLLTKCGTCLGIPDRDVPPAFRDDPPEDHA